MRNIQRIILSSLLVIIISGWQLCEARIVYPYRAVKTIVCRGESFIILYDSQGSAAIDSVILEGPYSRVRLKIDFILSGTFRYDSYTLSSVNTELRVKVPGGTPEDLYDLIVYSGKKADKSFKSVKVIKEFKKAHSFIHISDPHISRQWVGSPEDGYAKELELLDRFIEVANIIDPDFIIVTGDLIHDYTRINADPTGWGGTTLTGLDQKPYLEEKWKNCWEGTKGFSGLNGFNSPVFGLPGNHDFYGLKGDDYMRKASQWNNQCGIRVYGFSYGTTRIIASDDFLGDPVADIPDKSPMSGLQGKVLENFLKSSGNGSLRIMCQHRHDRIDTAFLDKNKISILLNGHAHTPDEKKIGTTPTLVSRPGVVCRSGVTDIDGELGYFRIFNIEGEKYSCTEPLRFCKDPTKPFRELELNLTIDFKNSNDGNSTRNEAVIRNDFPVDLNNCRIRFVMKKGNYRISGGTVRQIISTKNLSIVDINADIPKKSSNTIKIYP
jgi:DNA repair exonuclease SbcCD nuclease subunit